MIFFSPNPSNSLTSSFTITWCEEVRNKVRLKKKKKVSNNSCRKNILHQNHWNVRKFSESSTVQKDLILNSSLHLSWHYIVVKAKSISSCISTAIAIPSREMTLFLCDPSEITPGTHCMQFPLINIWVHRPDKEIDNSNCNPKLEDSPKLILDPKYLEHFCFSHIFNFMYPCNSCSSFHLALKASKYSGRRYCFNRSIKSLKSQEKTFTVRFSKLFFQSH